MKPSHAFIRAAALRLMLGAAVAFPLTSCAMFSAPSSQALTQGLATTASDIQLIGSGLSSAAGSLGTLGTIPAATVTKIQSDVASINALAAALQSATATTAPSELQQVETVVNDLVDTAAVLPLPPQFATALQAAAILLPVAEAAIGIVAGQIATANQATAVAAVNGSGGTTAKAMSPAASVTWARNALRTAH